jgi:SAM-dependent methyltransferase
MRSLAQARDGLRRRHDMAHQCAVRLERLERDEARIGKVLGREVRDLEILVVGHGPHLIEARYFGVRNRVTGIDLDVVPIGFDPAAYVSMLRRNGVGRTVKTVGRKLLGIDRSLASEWRRALHVERFREPRRLVGDICEGPPSEASFDLAVSWSVFQHIPDPERALAAILRALRPGAAVFIGIHLYTSNTGHHDIRAFTGGAASLPPWGHLRAATRHLVTPSAYLNQWRLSQWRQLFASAFDEVHEFREPYDQEAALARLDPAVRAELAGYSDDELTTVDVFFGGRKR